MKLPHSEAVEGGLIARLLINPDEVALVAGSLGPGDFYVGPFRRAYSEMLKLSQQRKSFDITTLQEALGDREYDLQEALDRVAGQERSAPAEAYAAIIRRDAFRRRMIGALESVIDKVEVTEDRDQLLVELNDAVVAISSGIQIGNLISPSQATEVYLKSLERRLAGHDQGLGYGLPAMDKILNPARGGEMIVLAARPGIGKSALAQQIADHWAQTAEGPILFVSLEMGLTSIYDRVMSADSRISSTLIVRGGMNEAQEEAVKEMAYARAAMGTGIWYLDDSYATTSSVRAAASQVRIQAGSIGGIVIDYLQLLCDPGDAEVQRVTKISRATKALAREFDIPVLALSQLSRGVESRQDPHPRLHDLRESGAIEQDADVVIALYRDTRSESPITDVEVLKQRQGGLGMAQLYFDRDHIRFEHRDEGVLREMLQIKEDTPTGWAVPR